mmetsp:Transcript_18480/g.33292  ORF Transcript_18480/g.33292 Transcript_18480/m.33292 type:complete len:82 (+) Transcript_18480:27-272(+)
MPGQAEDANPIHHITVSSSFEANDRVKYKKQRQAPRSKTESSTYITSNSDLCHVLQHRDMQEEGHEQKLYRVLAMSRLNLE